MTQRETCAVTRCMRTTAAFAKRIVLLLAAVLAIGNTAQAESQFVLAANMKVLRCDMPNTTYRFAGSNAPGQLFLPGEPVDIKLVFAKGQDQGEVKDFAIEIQEITTRDPRGPDQGSVHRHGRQRAADRPGRQAGHAPDQGPLRRRAARRPFEVKGLPVPARFGTYALVLTRGAEAAVPGHASAACPSRARTAASTTCPSSAKAR